MPPLRKFMLLGCLYFAQGLPYGFFNQAMPFMLREQGLSLTAIGIAQWLALPWMLKFLWAPMVENQAPMGLEPRRFWLLSMQWGAAVMFVLLGLFGSMEQLQWLMIGYFLANLFAATQDIATDGIAVNLLNDRERGFGNGLQVAAYRVGMIVGGGGILMFFAWLTWRGAFLLMGALIVLATLPLMLSRTPQAHTTGSYHTYFATLLHQLKKPNFIPWLLLIAFYKFGDAMGSHILRPYFSDLGLTLAQVGSLLGTIGFAGGLIGALVGGFSVNFLGRRNALLLLGLIQAVTVSCYAMIPLGIVEPLIALPWLTGGEFFTGGMATAALFTVMMDVCDPETGSTDYTIQACAVVLATGSAAAVGGALADTWGFTANFLTSGAASAVGCLMLFFAFPKIYPKLLPNQSNA
jgi:MFS family permease